MDVQKRLTWNANTLRICDPAEAEKRVREVRMWGGYERNGRVKNTTQSRWPTGPCVISHAMIENSVVVGSRSGSMMDM
jgi:hypothetical protein